MKRIVILLVLVCLALPSFAKNPVQTPGPPPPVWDTRNGREVGDDTPAVFDGPSKFPEINFWLSGALLPREVAPAPRKGATATEEPQPQTVLRRKLTAAPQDVPWWISGQYTADVSNVAGDENESSNIALTKNGTSYSVVSYQRTAVNEFYTVRVATATDPRFTGNFTSSIPYVPTGYNNAFDSTVTTNPYTDGIRPGAVYVTAGLGFSTGPGTGIGNPTQVRAWGSDDGGATWTTSGQVVASRAATETYLLDKPVADVSWYSGNRGYLYVVWSDVSLTNNQNHIMLRRNTNGLWQRCRPAGGGCDTLWDSPITINDGFYNEAANEAQVVTNADNGHVYVFWMDNINGRIQMRRSFDYGVTWDPPLTDVNGNHVAPINVVTNINVTCGTIFGGHCTGYLPNGIRGIVVPTIKYNTAAHNVMAAWHARTQNDPTDQTALYFVSFNADTIGGPVTPVTINDAAAAQLQPAIDNDDSGNVLVSYYTTQNHTADGQYEVYALSVTSTGGAQVGPTYVSGPFTNGFLGDYHENFYFTFPTLGSMWNTSWTQGSGGYDISLSGLR